MKIKKILIPFGFEMLANAGMFIEVMNRWMDYDLQTQLKCDLDENSLMEYFVNGRSKYKDR